MTSWYTKAIDRAVRERDHAYLVGLIRNERLSPEDRDYLATIVCGLLDGTVKRPAHRPKKERTESDAKLIAKEVVRLVRYKPQWAKLTAAVQKVAQDTPCAPSKVWDALRHHGARAVWDVQDDEYRAYDAMLTEANDAAWREAVERLKEEHGDRDFTAEEVRDEIYDQETRDWFDPDLIPDQDP